MSDRLEKTLATMTQSLDKKVADLGYLLSNVAGFLNLELDTTPGLFTWTDKSGKKKVGGLRKLVRFITKPKPFHETGVSLWRRGKTISEGTIRKAREIVYQSTRSPASKCLAEQIGFLGNPEKWRETGNDHLYLLPVLRKRLEDTVSVLSIREEITLLGAIIQEKCFQPSVPTRWYSISTELQLRMFGPDDETNLEAEAYDYQASVNDWEWWAKRVLPSIIFAMEARTKVDNMAIYLQADLGDAALVHRGYPCAKGEVCATILGHRRGGVFNGRKRNLWVLEPKFGCSPVKAIFNFDVWSEIGYEGKRCFTDTTLERIEDLKSFSNLEEALENEYYWRENPCYAELWVEASEVVWHGPFNSETEIREYLNSRNSFYSGQ